MSHKQCLGGNPCNDCEEFFAVAEKNAAIFDAKQKAPVVEGYLFTPEDDEVPYLDDPRIFSNVNFEQKQPVTAIGQTVYLGGLDFGNKQVYGTTVDVKRQYFKKFTDLMSGQFNHGGDKYTLKGFKDREATDVISSVFGGESEFDWILGTCMKYLFRFKNFQREKDLLKIATYMYILWLKQGNHLKESHDTDTSK